MDKLQELLKALSEAADDAAISDSLSRLEQDELVAAKDEIAARMLGIRDGKIEVNEVGADGKPVSPVEVVKALRAAHDTITAELAARAEAARLEAEEMAKATEDLEPAAEETPETEEVEEVEEVEEEEKVPVTAAVRHAAAYLGRVIEEEKNAAQAPNLDIVLTASGPVNRYGTLTDHTTMRDVGRLFAEGYNRVRDKASFIVAERTYPQDRQLGSDPVENTIRLNDVTSVPAIVAAGGICAPTQADFSHPVCGMERRPIRDALPAFQMSRGRLRYGPAVSFGDLAEAITIWDVDTDEEPGTAVKACPAITCEAELEAEVQAIVKCITIGNFQARYNPEFFAANLQALNVAFDAAAETQLFNQILAGSTAATTVDYGKGTVTNVLANLDLLAAGMRGSLRLPQGVTLDVILPDWIESALRSHLVNQPAAYAGQFDATGAWFAARNLRPIFSPDISLFSDPDDVTAFPATMPFVIYPNGTWVYGDGGTLDLGVVRDSTLNATNDLQVFAEGFEVAFKRGCASYRGTIAVDESVCIECVAS